MMENVYSSTIPDEVNVFEIPHTRMKQLVDSCMDLIEHQKLKEGGCLSCLVHLSDVFNEFRLHESIENRLIMGKLQKKLKGLSIKNDVVNNCHDDSQVHSMQQLINDGFSKKTYNDQLNYLKKLRIALCKFKDEFLPHMEEEEEIFLPLLVKHFPHQELRDLRDSILSMHNLDQKGGKVPVFPVSYDGLAPEILLHIFSHLDRQALGNAAQVCSSWNQVAYDRSLWHRFPFLCWAQGDWLESCGGDAAVHHLSLCNNKVEEYELIKKMQKESVMIGCLLKSILPKIAHAITDLDLSFSNLTSCQITSVLVQCQRIQILNLSSCRVVSSTFNCELDLSDLQVLILAGCIQVNDECIELIVSHMTKRTSALRELSLSGCMLLTDNGIRFLVLLSNIKHLDMSGCSHVSGSMLHYLVSENPQLDDLAYCDNITDGPQAKLASGCRNVSCGLLACCRVQEKM